MAIEVGKYDRLPPGGERYDARQLTRKRINVILQELHAVGPSTVEAVLQSIEHTQDECLRFLLWETACQMAAGAVADGAAARLRSPGQHFDSKLGGEAFAAAASIPEPVLTGGLALEEGDLKRATVERHGPAHDVQEHRRNLDIERNNARAYQALLLLAIASRRSPSGKELIRSWAESSDPDMSVAAWSAMAMYGEPAAAQMLRNRAMERGGENLVEDLLARTSPQKKPSNTPRRVTNNEQTQCSTCGRKPGEVAHMITGSGVVICDRCVVRLWQHRRSLTAPDEATCNLCGRSHFESNGLFTYNKVNICTHCVQLSLGLIEREEVDSFLSSW